MKRPINLQLFAEETIPEKPGEKSLETKPDSGFASTIRNAFGLKPKEQQKEQTKEPEKKPDEKPKEEVSEVKPEDKQEPETKEPEKKEPEEEFISIKHLGKEVKIPKAEQQKYLQMGYDYQHVKGEAESAKATLKRIAQTEGFNTVDEYLAELSTREKTKLAEKIEEAAGDPDKIDEIVQNHPVVRQTKEERQKMDEEKKSMRYKETKSKLSEDSFFKKLEPELDNLMEKNPTADPNLVYSVLVGNYVRSDVYKQELVKEREAAEKAAKEKDAAKEKKIMADIHDKERRAAPIGGDTGEGKDTVTPSAFTSKIAGVFGVSPQKVAQRAHEKMKRS